MTWRARDGIPLTRDELADRLSRGYEPVTWVDWFLVSLAALNVLLLVIRDIYGPVLPGGSQEIVLVVDLGTLVIFTGEFIQRLWLSGNRFGYAKNHWYDLVGLVPLAEPTFRAFRLVRLLRMYTVTNFPIERVRQHSWAWALVRGVVVHYRSVFVEEITDPLLYSWLESVEGPLTRARLAGTLGNSLDGRRADVRKAVEDAIRGSRGIHHVLGFDKGRQMVEHITDGVMDAVVHALESDELNDAISESLREVLKELRGQLGGREYKRHGGGLFKPVARG